VSDPSMRAHLVELLGALEAVGADHEELYDTECREQLCDAAWRAFIEPEDGYELPRSFGLYAPQADVTVRAALARYVERAGARAVELALDAEGRLDALRNDEVETDGERQYYDDFFGGIGDGEARRALIR